MAPTVKFKGLTRGTDTVSIYSVTVLNTPPKRKKPSQNANLMIKIKLPASVLQHIGRDDESDPISDPELSSLDDELNQALQSLETSPAPQSAPFTVTLKYSPQKPKPSGADIKVKAEKLTPEIATQKPTEDAKELTDTTRGYRTIPPNLITILKREFGLLNETAEELEMIEKMIFTLRDPLSSTKIKLPIKSVTCSHFECFDFDNFCAFSRLPNGVKLALRKDLIKKSTEMKKHDKKFIPKGDDIAKLTKEFMYQPQYQPTYPGLFRPPPPQNGGTMGNSQHHFPSYRCPVCNKSFYLNQLFISDIFNYFIKTTPMDIDRIELRDMVKYKIVTDEPTPSYTKKASAQPEEEIIVLSDSDSDSETESPAQEPAQEPEQTLGHSRLGPWQLYEEALEILRRGGPVPDHWDPTPVWRAFCTANPFPPYWSDDQVMEVRDFIESAYLARLPSADSGEETEEEVLVQRPDRYSSDWDTDDSFDRSYKRFQSQTQSQSQSHMSQFNGTNWPPTFATNDPNNDHFTTAPDSGTGTDTGAGSGSWEDPVMLD